MPAKASKDQSNERETRPRLDIVTIPKAGRQVQEGPGLFQESASESRRSGMVNAFAIPTADETVKFDHSFVYHAFGCFVVEYTLETLHPDHRSER